MRAVLCTAFVALIAACASNTDDAVTEDGNELNEGQGSLEKDLAPPLAAPKSPFIGAKMSDVYTQANGSLTPGAAKKAGDDCKSTETKDGTKVIVERVECGTSDVIRILGDDGMPKIEHYDLNKDGKVDRYTGDSGTVSQYQDTNFDGTIDVVVERVDKVKDFSMKGYDQQFPKSMFLFRVRESRKHDGKLDHERLTARGALPKE